MVATDFFPRARAQMHEHLHTVQEAIDILHAIPYSDEHGEEYSSFTVEQESVLLDALLPVLRREQEVMAQCPIAPQDCDDHRHDDEGYELRELAKELLRDYEDTVEKYEDDTHDLSLRLRDYEAGVRHDLACLDGWERAQLP